MDRPQRMEIRLKGLPLSEGYAVARVCRLNEHRHSGLPIYRVTGSGLEEEIGRVKQAVRVVAERLEKIREDVSRTIGNAEAEIFVAQKMIMEDPQLLARIVDRIRNDQMNAEEAVRQILDEYEGRLLILDSEYIRERATDFGEIKRRLLDALANMNPAFQCSLPECQRGRDRIIVAEELTPSLTVDIDGSFTRAFVTERGGVNSHAAILSRAMGIPAVSNLHGIRDIVGCGTELLVDGYAGEVVIWPTPETVREFQNRSARAPAVSDVTDPVLGFRVLANINLVSDVHETLEMKAEGIGLYRTEFEVMVAGRFFTEDECFEHYSAAIKAMRDHPVHFRLLDVGSDKSLPFMKIPKEENPSLGWRGSRLLLGRRDLLRTQARALAKCSLGRVVYVMYPMIVDIEQFRKIKAAFLEETRDVPQGDIRHGIMFEVPSACLMAEDFYREIDFASIGTNDLTQYLFAVDRDNELVSYDYDPDRRVFWELIRSIASAAQNAKKPISICGELAGDPRYIPKLIELGIRTVSVSARRISSVRRAAREILHANASTS